MKSLIVIMLISSFFLNCKNENKKSASTLQSQQNYSDLFLDKTAIDSFFISNPEKENIRQEVILFYQKRNLQYAWFNKNGMMQAVPNFQNQLQNYSNDFEDKTFDNKELDTLITLIKATPSAIKIDVKQRQKLELVLTTTFFKYSQKVFAGISKNTQQLDWYIPRSKKNFQVLLDSLVLKNENDRSYEPVNLYYSKLKQKLLLYRNIQKKGGFPIINSTTDSLNKTDAVGKIVQVKKRLFLSGDLKINDNNNNFTTLLTAAIAHFQERLGLPETGKLDDITVQEMNKTVDFRIKQILVNLERLRWVPVDMEHDYLLINIPEFKLHVFKNKKIIWETNVVVGKTAKQTTIFKGKLSRIILNPYWNIPNSIINTEILPKLKQNAGYLAKNNYEVVNSKGKLLDPSAIRWNNYTKNVPFIIRQKPGSDNALGKIKFLFPNNFNIYLHDTPSKNLFSKNKRDFSHGCIRVENPRKLAQYLLRNNKTWGQTNIDQVLQTNTETGITVNPTIPVYITYFTAWVDMAGELNFRNDIYDLDDKLSKEIFAE